MPIVSIDKLAAGQQTTEDVLSPQGMLICKAGQTISEKHLKAFKAWGVTEVNVVGQDSQEEMEGDLDNMAEEMSSPEVMEEIERLFSKTDLNDPVIAELHQLVIERRLNP
jgi:hypothetical protein